MPTVMEADTHFATALRRLRRGRGLSQVLLAQRAQVSERTLRYWEAGTTFPGEWELQSAATALALTQKERAHLFSLMPNRRGAQAARRELASSSLALFPAPALGDLLRAMRLRRRLTQSQAAEYLRVTRSTLLRWEATRSLPSEGNLERLCVLYDAHREEHRVLQSRRMQPLGEVAPASLSLDLYEEKVARLSEAINWPDSPLIDLHALLLKRALWPLALQSEDAQHLLLTVEMRHGLYLIEQNRKKEATACLKHGLTLFQGRRGNHEIGRELINVAAPYVGKGRTENENGLRVTQKWLPAFPASQQAPLWCDAAIYAGSAGQHDYAAYCLKQAQKFVPLSRDPAHMSEQYFPFSQAKTLVKAKRPWEAIDCLSRLPAHSESAGSQVFQRLFMIEAFIDAKETAHAQRSLDAVGRHFEQYPQPLYMPYFNRLAARI